MIYKDNEYRYRDYYKWEKRSQSPYNYEKHGLIKHLLSNKLINTNNSVLRVILAYYENSIVFLLKYVDRLKHFKNHHWKNR